MRYSLVILFSLFIPAMLNAQTVELSRELNWGNELKQVSPAEGITENILHFEGAVNDPTNDYLPVLVHSEPINVDGKLDVTLSGISTEPLINSSLANNSNLITNDFQVEANIAYERKQPVLVIEILPLRKGVGDNYEKLTSFNLQINIVPSTERRSGRRGLDFKANSVLASGNWHKIAVRKTGVYRMDRSFLENELGWDMSQVDPRNIRIYGNGGGMLPEPLSLSAPDDLNEIAIKVQGEGDGSFDNSDFILFYGESPTKLLVDSSDKSNLKVKHQIHLYDSLTYYFITKDLGAGKRITSQASEPSFTNQSTGYSFHDFHEVEMDNLTNSGRQFHGETFDFITNSRSFDFNIPNFVSGEPLEIKTEVAARSVVGSSQFSLFANGQLIGSESLGKVGIEYWKPYAKSRTFEETYLPSSSNLNLSLNYQPNGSDPDSRGWLDYISINGRVKPIMAGNQMSLFDLNSFGPGMVTQFKLSGSANLNIWDVTNHNEVKSQQTTFNSGTHTFSVNSPVLKKFIAFNGNEYYSPKYIGAVANQNLHASLGQPEMVIVTHHSLSSEANRLADFHRQEDNMDVKVVDVRKIYNEFSGGAQDITAIRNMMKMLYDRANNGAEMPKYLLMFGDASFDYKNIELSAENNTNLVPSYESYETLNRSSTFVSDDYFGLLDDNEGQNIVQGTQLMDLGIGRIMADSEEEARTIVDKIFHYHNPKSYGSWRNTVTFIADDEDANTHINQAELLADSVNIKYPSYNIDKIYLDAYEQISTPGGSRYPGVEEAIESRIFSGTLVMNYTGHGGEGGLAHERIITQDKIRSWTNYDKLMLMITATCSFSRYDNPSKETAGELCLTNDEGGAVALISTVRLVYASGNFDLNNALLNQLFHPINGKMPTLGEVIQRTKNNISTGSNNRKFTLLGDPAMTLGYPKLSVSTTKFNNEPFVQNGDTLSALEKVTISGIVKNENGTKADAFNGVVYPTIYDKSVDVRTLKNDGGSKVRTFDLRKNIIYRGKASVTNGEFEYTFVVPKDINYEYGIGKISYYANDGTVDAHGNDSIVVGGSADSFAQDNDGPEVTIYMNDESFVFGGITDPNPIMLVKLSDENGINTAGNAIGHNITGILDEKDNNQMVLNDFYEAALNDYTKGEVRYPLSDLEPGTHQVEVTAWDVYNNSGTGYTEFVVAESSELALDHVLNYPNPFTTSTEFWFEHNKPGQALDVRVEVYTVSGRLVKTIEENMVTEGYRVTGIEWNGLDDFGDKIGKGVYIYKVAVRAEDNTTAEEFEKLVILK